MISVIVQRQPAGKPGPDISDALITTEAVARERGRNEIDANCSSRKMLTGTGPALAFIRRGKIVEVMQTGRPAARAMVTGWSLDITRTEDSVTVDQTLDLEAIA
jgi:hypothetical protein